jgi:hypothetical protein
MNHAEARVDRQQAIDAEMPLSGTTSGVVPEIAVIRRAQRARKNVDNASGKQRRDAAEARDDAPRLRVDRRLAIDPRANTSGGPHETVAALAPALARGASSVFAIHA